jgi:F-type H+-transporting ATPase subunit alpha
MKIDTVLKNIEEAIDDYKPSSKVERVGQITSLADGVAHINGLETVASGELLQFAHKIYGLTLNLEEDSIGCVILGDYKKLHEGDTVKGTGRLLSIPVSNEILGRVVDPLGMPLDNKGPIKNDQYMSLERIAPGVIEREPVNTPVQTGIKAIDAMTPVGRGQRQLIIGDRGTGKTSIALDSIINQGREKSGVICIYVAIGQKTSRVAQLIDTLKKYDAMDYTVVVSADSSMPASLQYLAPYAGCAIGEYFLEKGKEAVVFYDDLSKHAWAYREVSLMLRRPSGREAYPGDIFYLHSRLLERACKLNKKRGGGSLTAFPIIETQAGDISAYIPTNVISITDGQIYLESDLFYSGIRPAINVGNSVSRVGGAAQIPIMKKVAGTLRMDLAQYRELAAFVQFAADLDESTKKRIEQGSRMVELLKQPLFEPVPVEEQVAVIFAGTSGKLSTVSVSDMIRFEKEFRAYIRDYGSKTLKLIQTEKKMNDTIKEQLEKLIDQFLEQWQPLEPSKEE